MQPQISVVRVVWSLKFVHCVLRYSKTSHIAEHHDVREFGLWGCPGSFTMYCWYCVGCRTEWRTMCRNNPRALLDTSDVLHTPRYTPYYYLSYHSPSYLLHHPEIL